MTTEELRVKVAESPNLDSLNSKEVKINFSHIGFQTTLIGVTSVYVFLCQQIEGFDNRQVNLPQEFSRIKKIYEQCRRAIIDIVNGQPNPDGNWDAGVKAPLESKDPPKFVYDSPYFDFLVNIYNQNPSYYPGGYEYFTKNNLVNIRKDTFVAYLLAYEFSRNGLSSIDSKKEREQKAIEHKRKDFENYLTDSESQLVNYLSTAYQKVENTTRKIDTFVKQRNDQADAWFKDFRQKFESYYEKSSTSIDELKDLYQQKLKLEAPAKYWNDRARSLRKQGGAWLIALVICILGGVSILIWVLSMISDGSIEKVFSNTGTAIKWSVVLVTLISFLAFAIRTFSKLVFSSFHLYRDAEEREQLTYVYLSLQREKGIDQTERHLIMQSLFSRADSGLLKDEASPTMPGNIVDKMVAK